MTDPKNISQEIVDLIANLHDSVPKGEQYVNVCDRVLDVVGSNSYKYNDLPSLSHEAWLYGQQISLAKKGVKETDESEEEKEEQTKTRYWLYSPGRNASYWEECVDNSTMVFGFDEIGDLKRFHSQKEMQEAFRAQDENPKSLDSYAQSAHMTWEFLNVLKQGDVVFVKKGRSKIIGRGIVSSDEYNYDSSRPEYKSWRDVKWTHKGEWDYIEGASAPMKTLTDMTPYVDICNTLKSLFEDSDGGEPDSVVDPVTIEEIPPYSRADFLRDVFMTDADYETLVGLLKAKKNVVLQGAPGVGKTFIADRLAYSIMGEKNKSRVMTVQFHQSYSYEDFIMGYRPTESGFKLNHGAFYDFCKKAEIDPDSEYFFIIDEINRGNMSKIFGELFMLVEADKRGKELRLLYSNELFSVPKNVYLIGTMNTADRSLALLDYALRRRFAFFEVSPGFASGGFGEYRARLNNPRFDALVARVEALNREIAEDPSLGKGFSVGHSYFCGLNPENVDARLPQIVEYELVPLLAEYWFDEPKKVEEQARKLRDALR